MDSSLGILYMHTFKNEPMIMPSINMSIDIGSLLLKNLKNVFCQTVGTVPSVWCLALVPYNSSLPLSHSFGIAIGSTVIFPFESIFTV